jgi:hypothetical protein
MTFIRFLRKHQSQTENNAWHISDRTGKVLCRPVWTKQFEYGRPETREQICQVCLKRYNEKQIA